MCRLAEGKGDCQRRYDHVQLQHLRPAAPLGDPRLSIPSILFLVSPFQGSASFFCHGEHASVPLLIPLKARKMTISSTNYLFVPGTGGLGHVPDGDSDRHVTKPPELTMFNQFCHC